MSATVINLAAWRTAHGQAPQPPAQAVDHLANWESERQWARRLMSQAASSMADDLPTAVQRLEGAAHALKRLIAEGLLTEYLEQTAAIKTARRIAAAKKGAETRARGNARA